MSSFQKVSRAQFFDSDNLTSSSDSEEAYTTAFEIEIAEVEDEVEDEKEKEKAKADEPAPLEITGDNEDQEMTEAEISQVEQEKKIEYFPLFSVDPSISSSPKITGTYTTGDNEKPLQGLVRVSLKDYGDDDDEENEDDFEKIIKNQKRPDSYYFSKYNEVEKLQFEQVALSGEDILKVSSQVIRNDYKLVNLAELNDAIAKETKCVTKVMKLKGTSRSGKNKRLGKIAARLRQNEFKKEMVNIKEREKQRELMKLQKKKKPTRRGGKRNKKHNQQANNQQDDQKKQQQPVSKT